MILFNDSEKKTLFVKKSIKKSKAKTIHTRVHKGKLQKKNISTLKLRESQWRENKVFLKQNERMTFYGVSEVEKGYFGRVEIGRILSIQVYYIAKFVRRQQFSSI